MIISDDPSPFSNAGEMLAPQSDLAPLPDGKTNLGNTAANLGRLLLDLYQLAMSSPIGEFDEQLFLLLQEYISFDSAWMGKSTLILHGPQMHNSYLYKLPDQYVADWEQVKAYDPITPKSSLSRKKLCW